MSDVSSCDFYARRNLAVNADRTAYTWSPTRLGETTRTCQVCGSEFEPRTRTQKYCSNECKLKRKESK